MAAIHEMQLQDFGDLIR